jgi:predicted nucleic acid-binding protein
MPDISAKVVDCSALVAMLFDEEAGAEIAVRLGSATLVAPVLLHFEIASVCLKKLRRFPAERDALLAAYQRRRRLPVETLDVDYAGALSLADRTGLTVYDASYLWLARSLGAELVTLDVKLAQADAHTP